MHERAHSSLDQPSAVPPRIALDDLVEAVSKGVARALQAEDDVAGYKFNGIVPGIGRPPILIGVVVCPPGDPGNPGQGPVGLPGDRLGGFPGLG